MDLKIIRNVNQVNINVFQKPTPADTTIHFTSNHSIEYNVAAYKFYIRRLDTLPQSQEHKTKRINTVKQIAVNNGYPYS